MSKEKEILEKIKNKESLTRDEMVKIHNEDYVAQLEQQFNEDSSNSLNKEEHKAYLEEIFKEEIEIDRKIKELEDRKENQIYEIVKSIKSGLSFPLQQPQPAQKCINTSELEEYFEKYLIHRESFNKVSSSSLKAYRASYRYLKYFVDDDTTYNFSFFKELQQKLQNIPKNFFKYTKYYTKQYEEVIRLRKKEQYAPLDNKTINNHMSNIKTFFDYLAYEEIIQENPLTNIKSLPESSEVKKEEYTKDDLEKIFSSNIEPEFINMCKVALYAGLRIEEVLSLKKADIKENLIHVDLGDSSTKKHKRIVPIHKNLLNTIEEQKKVNKGVYLFFIGNTEKEVKNIGKQINGRLQKIVTSPQKTFHSLRKNFSQELEINTQAEEKIKKYLMGHSMSKDITHMIYNRGKMNVEKLVECIGQITFDY